MIVFSLDVAVSPVDRPDAVLGGIALLVAVGFLLGQLVAVADVSSAVPWALPVALGSLGALALIGWECSVWLRRDRSTDRP